MSLPGSASGPAPVRGAWASLAATPRAPAPPTAPLQARREQHLAIQCATAQQQQQQQQPEPHASAGLTTSRATLLRRGALLSVAGAAAGAQLLPSLTPAAVAAAEAAGVLPPFGPARYDARSPRSTLELGDSQLLPLPPRPIGVPRRTLDLNFAVLCLRSGYEAADDLDFVAMDEFQKKFWKLRQAEWEPYTIQYAPLRITQGDLQSPLYFDFISFVQACSAGAMMKEGKQVFEEYSEETEGKVLVTRDPSLSDNALLPARFFEREGERLYRGVLEGFRGVQYGAPPPAPPGAPMDTALAGVQQLLDIYVDRGYALKATLTPAATPNGSGGGPAQGAFEVRLEGAANLWSLQALASRRSNLYNVHDAATVAAYLRACGLSSTCRLSWTDTSVVQAWSVA